MQYWCTRVFQRVGTRVLQRLVRLSATKYSESAHAINPSTASDTVPKHRECHPRAKRVHCDQRHVRSSVAKHNTVITHAALHTAHPSSVSHTRLSNTHL